MEVIVGKKHKNVERLVDWDVRISDGPITYFDPLLSYEATGYRPIDATHGLEFDPKWFNEAAVYKSETGMYSPYKFGTKAYRDFWTEQGWRCREGYTSNGYTITGDNYYFLNFYQLLSVDVEMAGQGRDFATPDFYVEQYKYFHYVQLARFYGLDCCTLKSRGIGWSEVNACLAANMYTWRQNTGSLIIAYDQKYVEDTIKKVFDQLDYNNSSTEGGMRRLRQAKDQALFRRSSHFEYVDGKAEEKGMKSEIRGLVADTDRKIRGKRVELLMIEESGSYPELERAFRKSKELVIVQGKRIGNVLLFGTGGDSGPNLEGLANIFNDPISYGVLGYKHNNTKTGDYIISGFFVPAWSIVRSLMDERGYTDEKEGKAYYQSKRDEITNPKDLLNYCAEQCWTPEEALALEGDNRFNKELLSTQRFRIVRKSDKEAEEMVPKIQRGRLEYTFFDGNVDEKNISGIEFIPSQKPDPDGEVVILEPPMKPEGTNQVYQNLYIAGIDGIDFGKEDTSSSVNDKGTASKFCIVIKKRQLGMEEPKYVAYYMGRHDRVKDDYMQALKLIQWYNAKAMIEKTRIGFLSFMDSKKLKYRYMMRRPKSTESDKGMQGSSRNNFGAPATENAIQHGLTLVADYIEEYCHNIWFEDMIKQLMEYSYEKKTKFDLVAAMQMAELADEEMMAYRVITDQDETFGRKDTTMTMYVWRKDDRGHTVRVKTEVKSKHNDKGNYNKALEDELYNREDVIYTSNPIYNEYY